MRKIIIIVLVICTYSAFPQGVSLKECIDTAVVRYPLIHQSEWQNQIAGSQMENIKAGNLPQVNISAQATWQSEVMELPIQLPGITIPSLNKDQYKIQLEINQAIYKGGITKAQKELISSETRIADAQNNVEILKLKTIIISLYFQILLTDNSIEVLKAQEQILQRKLDELDDLVKAGVMLEGVADALKAEILSLDQRLIELNYSRTGLISKLTNYTGFDAAQLQKLEIPELSPDFNSAQQRPEYQLMEYNRTKLNALQNMQKANNRPMAFAFSTIGYGRPGFNYLNNDFAPYALVGLGVKWKIWDWNLNKNNIEILDFQSKIIENQQQTFNLNLNAELISLRNEITKQQALLAKAKELIPIRERIMKMTESQFQQGIIRSSDFINESKNMETAQLNVKIIEVRLALSKVNYLIALGNI